jgi:molybdate transport system substrate-binding protein
MANTRKAKAFNGATQLSRPISLGCLCTVGLAALTAGGCDSGSRTNPQPLRIAAAADLQRVLPRLIERFEKQTGTATTLTIDASGRLAEQIKAGAPFDLFLSANVKFVSDLAKDGLIEPESVRPYARGSLVLCVHNAVRDQVGGLVALSRPEIKRIAIANPEYAPYGMAARQALERAGLWSTLESKIVRASSVGQALTYVQNGDAEAALVSHAQIDPELHVIEVETRLYDPLIQALGIVAATKDHDRARALAEFVLGKEGQAILKENGFLNLGASTGPTGDGATNSKHQ